MNRVIVLTALSAMSFATFAQEKTMDGKMEKKEMKMKEHVCTKACANGKHAYAHGEKGHVCTDACKKMKM